MSLKKHYQKYLNKPLGRKEETRITYEKTDKINTVRRTLNKYVDGTEVSSNSMEVKIFNKRQAGNIKKAQARSLESIA